MFGSVKKAGRMRGFCLSLFSALNFFSNWRMDIKCFLCLRYKAADGPPEASDGDVTA